MYRIVKKEALKPTVILYEIEAPMVAKKAEPGQFIILRVDENGERIPITIHDYDREKGTVTIIVQTVGATTEKLSHKQQGECLHDFVGPLGKPTETEGKKKVCVVGGGVGCAIAYPVLKKFHDCGAEVHAVVGFKSKDVVILEDKFKAVSSVLKVCTDDGSYGRKGLVTEALKELLDEGNVYDEIFAIGPMVMMKFVCKTTAPYNMPTTVSMSPIMIEEAVEADTVLLADLVDHVLRGQLDARLREREALHGRAVVGQRRRGREVQETAADLLFHHVAQHRLVRIEHRCV